jgi:hypothetical protein
VSVRVNGDSGVTGCILNGIPSSARAHLCHGPIACIGLSVVQFVFGEFRAYGGILPFQQQVFNLVLFVDGEA